MAKFEVIESRHWLQESTGRTASIYGALPAGEGWEIVQRGWTVRNPHTGQVGIGRQPWATKAEAEDYAAKVAPLKIGYGD